MEKYIVVYTAIGLNLVELIECEGVSEESKRNKNLFKTYFNTEEEARIFCNGVELVAHKLCDVVKNYVEDNTPRPASDEVDGEDGFLNQNLYPSSWDRHSELPITDRAGTSDKFYNRYSRPEEEISYCMC